MELATGSRVLIPGASPGSGRALCEAVAAPGPSPRPADLALRRLGGPTVAPRRG